jgi:hypothetical protein
LLRAAFVRFVGERDRIYVTRSDGSEASWTFPTYGDGLPHDLVHLVVESAFSLARGFWGRVDEGAEPKIINDQANRRGGADKYSAFGPDRTELMLSESLAAAPWGHGTEVVEHVRTAYRAVGLPPPDRCAEWAGQSAQALSALGERWRRLVPKGTLDAWFDRRSPRAWLDSVRPAPTSTVSQGCRTARGRRPDPRCRRSG